VAELPDGTRAEITGLTNEGDVITVNVDVVWPDKSTAKCYLQASQPIRVVAGALGLKGMEAKDGQ